MQTHKSVITSITNGKHFSASEDLSVVRTSMVLALDDKSVAGYRFVSEADVQSIRLEGFGSIRATPFLVSDTGMAIWGEKDGKVHLLDGKVIACIVHSRTNNNVDDNTSVGPVVEFLTERPDGTMRMTARVRCVELLGIAPNSKSQQRINEYRDLLAMVRLSNLSVMH